MKSFLQNNYNYILYSAIISWFCAQVIKTLINFFTTKKFNAERLIGAGGMPSSHSAFVCSATVATSRITGVSSPEFAIILIVAFIVMYDAMGVRQAASSHAREINRINKIYRELTGKENKTIDENKNKELNEFLGHTPYEVLGGALLGIIIALMVPMK